MSQEPTFWSSFTATLGRVWAVFKGWILGPGAALIVVAVAVVLVVLGFKDLQVGGLLDKLLGREKPKGKKAVDVANSIPEDRIDEDGKLIPIGEPDKKGITQAEVVEIEKPGMFDDPNIVKIRKEGEEPQIVQLPEGVKAKDVDKVVIVTPEVTVVTVKNTSKVSASDVDDLLDRYGSI